MAAWYETTHDFTLSGAEGPVRVRGKPVTQAFVRVLGVRPILGSTFSADEECPGKSRVGLNQSCALVIAIRRKLETSSVRHHSRWQGLSHYWRVACEVPFLGSPQHQGSYVSATAEGLKTSPPPAIRTSPLISRVAVCPVPLNDDAPVFTNEPVAGS